MIGAAVGMAGLGIGLGWWLYVARPELPGRIADGAGALYQAVLNKYWVDELYDAVIVNPLVKVSDRVLFRGVDAGLIDGGLVNGPANAIRGLAAHGLKYTQSGLAQGYLFVMVVGVLAVVGYLVR